MELDWYGWLGMVGLVWLTKGLVAGGIKGGGGGHRVGIVDKGVGGYWYQGGTWHHELVGGIKGGGCLVASRVGLSGW